MSTEDHQRVENPVHAAAARTSTADAAALIDVVTAVPGVIGLEPGVATTLRTLDARLRRSDPSASRYGLVIDRDTGDVTVEIAVRGPLPLRSTVEEVQRTVRRAMGDRAAASPQVLVRVQSLGTAGAPGTV
ncbi:hypothetical protein ACT3SP_01395 [Brachybacterium sp. AOP43-C2-M15]|uniref:hypothetical protein n=1 Tax=Brachybacterium sp. AOP43-C2-M15 TaxID=3457661 RepID=UPI00403448CC